MAIQRKVARAAAILIGAAALTAALAAPAHASFVAEASGTGPTAAAAEQAADNFFFGDYYGCDPINPLLVSDTELSDGTWVAVVDSDCTGWL